MSFAYMPFYTGDYIRDTRHLTPMRHGVYVLALAHCWDTKGPMPLDEQECAGIVNARSADEIEALRYVLGKYFVRMDDGHYSPRMQKEIERSEAISRERAEAGRKGYEARAKQLTSKRQAIAKQVHLPPSPSPSLSPSPPPSPSPSLPPTAAVSESGSVVGETDTPAARKRATSVSVKDLESDGVDQQCAADWMAVRRAKKLPLTRTAWTGVKREAAKARLSPGEAVRIAAMSGWAGFKAEWLHAPSALGQAGQQTAANAAALEKRLFGGGET